MATEDVSACLASPYRKGMIVGKSTRTFYGLLLVLTPLAISAQAISQQFRFDTAAAHAVLKALHDPDLNLKQAMDIAKLDGNQGMIKKMRELGEADTDEQFAQALVAAARGQAAGSPQEEHYNFARVKSSSAVISRLLDQIEHGFDGVIRDRIHPYVSNPDALSMRGFIVAGGDGSGYSFGGSDFFVNMAFNTDLPMLQQVTIHEAFHGVQGAVYQEDTDRWAKGLTRPADFTRGQFCSHAAELLIDLRNEGTAMYVGSDELLKDSTSETGKRVYGEWLYYNGHRADSAGLLEISLASLQAPRPVPYKLVYQVDFYGKGVAYYIAAAMTEAIVDQDGASAVGQIIRQPGYEFVLRYTRLRSYGKDARHPPPRRQHGVRSPASS